MECLPLFSTSYLAVPQERTSVPGVPLGGSTGHNEAALLFDDAISLSRAVFRQRKHRQCAEQLLHEQAVCQDSPLGT